MDEPQDELIYAEIERLRKARPIVLPRPKNFNKVIAEDDPSLSRKTLAITTLISALIGVVLFLIYFYMILP